MKALHYFTLAGILSITLFSCTTPDSELSGTKVYMASGLQEVLVNEYSRGEERFAALKEVAEDRTQRDLQNKAVQIYNSVLQMDEDAAVMIDYLEHTKLKMFHGMGLPKSTLVKKGILARPYSKKDQSYPSAYDLSKCSLTGSTDILDPDGAFAKEIIQKFETFRKTLCEKIAASVLVEKGYPTYYFKDPMIREFSSLKDLNNQIETAIVATNVAMDDREAIKIIYAQLSHTSKGWQQLLIDKIYWADAFAILSQLEADVLRARADAISLIRSRIGCGGCYGFDKIIPIAYGPEVAHEDDVVYIDVLMAAYDSNKQPFVESKDAEVVGVKDGKAHLKIIVGKAGKKLVTGTITIKNKSGIPKTMVWKKEIVVLPSEK